MNEGLGLFIGLIAYHHSIDGKILFKEIKEKIFDKHREYLALSNVDDIERCLYSPTAYRMFGNERLAVLSLIDDYAFSNRIFNEGHIVESNQNESDQDNSISENLDFKSIAITGSHTCSDGGKTLIDLSKDTFLKTKEDCRYAFMGIIRMKINDKLLADGSNCFEEVKKRLNKIEFNGRIIVVETYDIDELAVVVFSGGVRDIHDFYKSVRRLKNDKNESFFISCFLNLGHHLDFSFSHCDGNWIYSKPENYKFKCVIEPKPGYERYVHDVANKLSQSNDCGVSAVGSCNVSAEVDLLNIEKLYDLSIDYDFNFHVKRIKISLSCHNEQEKKDSHVETVNDSENHNKFKNESDNFKIPLSFIFGLKDKLKELGISKIVRERLLSLFALYNDCVNDKLHCRYVAELQGTLRYFKERLELWKVSGDKLYDFEKTLSEEIDAIESAIYNRMRNRMTPNAILEYGGGIQQFLISYSRIFVTLSKLLSHDDADRFYCLVSGVGKVFTEAGRLNLNINHILYPQLFATTIWKEASNGTFYQQKENSESKEESGIENTDSEDRNEKRKQTKEIIREQQRLKKLFDDIINDDRDNLFDKIHSILYWKMDLYKQDRVHRAINAIINKDLIEYATFDYIVFNFGFLKNYELMWNFYLKTFLATASFSSKGKVDFFTFIFVLLRLIIVAYLANEEGKAKDLLSKPFDYLLAPIWIESSDIVFNSGFHLTSILSQYGLKTMLDNEVFQVIYKIHENKNTSNVFWSNLSSKCNELSKVFKTNHSPVIGFWNDLTQTERIIVVLNAYMVSVYNMDKDDTDASCERVLNSLPLNYESEGKESLNIQGARVANILSDCSGGFFIPKTKHRQQYFALNTTFFRTLRDIMPESD